MNNRRFSLKAKLNIYILSAAMVIYCIAIGYISYRLKEIAYTDAVEIVKSSTREFRNKISEDLNVTMEAARTMRNVFEEYKKYDKIQREVFFDNILSSNLKKNPDFLSIGLYWEIKTLDESYNKRNGRIRNIFYRSGNEIKIHKEVVDTTNNEVKGIYYEARALNREMILDPYYDKVTADLSGILMTTIFTPLQSPKGAYLGLVGIDISLNAMNKLITELRPYKESVAYIIGGNNMVVSHTESTYTGKDFFSTLNADTTAFRVGFNNLNNSVGNSFTYINTSLDEEFLVSFEPVLINNKKTNWIIGVEVPTSIILTEAKNVFIQAIVVGVIGLILLFIIIYFIAHMISSPVVEGVKFAKTISEGNLNATLRVKRNDEIGELAESLGAMAARLKMILNDIIQSANTISESSSNLQESSVKLSEGANNQAASSEEISTTIDHMLGRIQQNTLSAQETEKIAVRAAQGIQEGNESTRALIQSMNNILQRITIVGEIAKQTNLLAINAAIEASRSGIQGKGFGVVAAEIKKLAERAQLAAKEIDELSIEGLKRARETGQKLEEVMPDIEHTAILIRKIVESSIEQKNSSAEMNQGIQQLNIVTQQNAESSFELSMNSKKITKQVENLKSLISYFKTN